MALTDTFNVGDYIIDSDQIFVVSKIEQERLHYKPTKAEGRYQSVTGSIPIQNVSSSGFRLLLAPKDFNSFITQLSLAKPSLEPIDSKLFKELLCLNDPFKIIPLLKQLWIHKNNPATNFSGSNRDTMESILRHLTDEFSLVTHKSPESIRTRIVNTLTKKKN
jgi:RNA polymerase-interacting CarD/CdnL/TRCF family regulator